MTDEELDEARAQAALEFVYRKSSPKSNSLRQLAIIAARLAREGWKPTDKDLIKARELTSSYLKLEDMPTTSRRTLEGNEDDSYFVKLAVFVLKNIK